MTIPQALELALQHHRAGRLAEAEALYRQVLAVQPNHAGSLHLLGVIAHQAGQNDVAIERISQSIAIEPNNPFAQSNLGEAYRAAGRLDEAMDAYRRALQLKPDFLEAINNLGNTLSRRGELHEAIAAYRSAIKLKPDYADAHNNLGAALALLGLPDEAVAAYRHALELRPRYSQALNNIGNALKDQGELDEAITAFRHALKIKPGDASIHSNLIYTLHYHLGHTAESISQEHQQWNRQFSDPLKPLLRPHTNDPDPDRRLRIGYFSPDFRDHSVGRYVLPLFEHHNREQFEILCYSGVVQPDSATERLRALTQGWRNTFGVPDAQLAETIREDAVDILVDLALHSGDNRLPMFARQPAPVQVAWLAYAGSTGLPGMGYRLTDALMDLPGEKPAWSTEEPVRLPDCWCCYDPGGEVSGINPLPALSAQGITFGSMNNFAKIHDGVLALWARLLEVVKGSRLLMFCPEGRARERVRTFFSTRGVGPERIELAGFLPRLEHLRFYHQIDLALDPFPYNGMATTCDALWMGVPVLTLPGTMPASRVGLSLLSTVGLPEFAASSQVDYVNIAATLAADLPRLANLRATLRSRMRSSPLMDAPRFAQNVEAAYRSMWRNWCATEPVESC